MRNHRAKRHATRNLYLFGNEHHLRFAFFFKAAFTSLPFGKKNFCRFTDYARSMSFKAFREMQFPMNSTVYYAN